MTSISMMENTAKMIDVLGGSLRYRWLPAQSGPVLVFENGWGASLEQWAWVEKELAGRASLLFYSHAGIGGSTLSRPQTPAGISAQFVAMLDGLGIHDPVVLVGHSFGGLISALHAAQIPDRIAALVQIDNTQEVDDAQLDKPLALVKWIGGFAILCARLGLRDPVFSGLSEMLPSEEGARMQKLSFSAPASLRAALAELALLHDIRAAIAASSGAQPRLVISADCFDQPEGVVGRMLSMPDAVMTKRLQHIQSLHRAQIRQPNARWMTLPHSHGNLVFTAAGAADTAREVFKFAVALNASRPELLAS
ncbi:MAG: alpha/beta fold hydrolase [Pseudomonadota bacterium]